MGKSQKLLNKFALALAIIFIIPSSHSQSSDEQQFMQSMENFMKSKLVTTWFPNTLTAGSCPRLVSGAVNKFGLNPVSDKTASSIYPKSSGGISAYWLPTREMITVPRSGSPKIYVVTPELNGCSIYIRGNPGKNTVSIFHHYREESKAGPGNAKLTKDKDGKYVVMVNNKEEKFDDVFAWEQYGQDSQSFSIATAAFCGIVKEVVDKGKVEHLTGTHTTAFIQGDSNGGWDFVYQKFRNSPQTDSNKGLKGFSKVSSGKKKAYVSEIIQKPKPVVTKKPKEMEE